MQYHKKYTCAFSCKNKRAQEGISKRNLNCPVLLDIQIKLLTKDSKKKDAFLRQSDPLGGIITITRSHNHNKSATVLQYLRPTHDIREIFLDYFQDMSPAMALRVYQDTLKCREDFEEVLADGHTNPLDTSVYYWHKLWRLQNYGPLNEPLATLEKKIELYENLGSTVVVSSESPWTVLVATPVMKRAQSLFSTKSITFVDTTASVDSTCANVTVMLTSTKAGAVPIAVLIHESQSEICYTKAFRMFRETFPEGFGGHNYPHVFMSDNSSAEKGALLSVWPESIQLLCGFHVGQAEWQWLEKNVEKSFRQTLMRSGIPNNVVDDSLVYIGISDLVLAAIESIQQAAHRNRRQTPSNLSAVLSKNLRRGPGANVQDSCGYTALHHAALNGHKDVVEMLLSHEASCNVVDDKGSSPLHLAAWTGNEEVVSLLLTHGPSVPNVNLLTRSAETPLHCAAQYGHSAVVSLLLDHGCDPSIRNAREESALDLAAQYGRLDTVERLIRTHPELLHPYASRSSATIFQNTPLHLASRCGHRAVVDLLLDAGVDVNVRTGAGTALHEAALHGKVEVARALLRAGVDLRVRDSSRKTVTDLLRDFPSNVSHEIDALIRRHRVRCGDASDGEDTGGHGGGGHSPRSPYENASPRGGSSPIGIMGGGHHGGGCSPRGCSPNNYQSSGMSIASESSFGRDLDEMSLSSVASSTSNRRGENIYLPMGGRSPGSTCRISPTPPKKPPRRNLSVSPTHLSTDSPYEFLCLARTGGAGSPGSVSSTRPTGVSSLRRGKSADQYVEMKLRHIDLDDGDVSSAPGTPSTTGAPEQASPFEEVTIRTINPRRKLRRVHEPGRGAGGGARSYENCEPTSIPVLVTVRRDSLDVSPIAAAMALPAPAISRMPLRELPLSPTHYQQPPTPDHPPPSAQAAERSIHERIRPLSQEYHTHKRSSRDMETETDDDLLVCSVWNTPGAGSLSGSVCSSISMHSDNLVEEYIGDAPFAASDSDDSWTRSTWGRWGRPVPSRAGGVLQQGVHQGAEQPPPPGPPGAGRLPSRSS
ncbi:Ankyrin repeat and sterile alpha motif domain-containing protein 1B, partial [Frankliniella fusca]